MSIKTSELKSEVVAFKRRRILEVSAHLFFEQGYEGTTLDNIAENLNVTKPYLYSYFQNKGEILYEICQTGIRLSLSALDEALALKGPPLRRLKAAVEQVARIVIEKRGYVAVYQREEMNLPPEKARQIRELRKSFDRKMKNLLREGSKTGDFEVEDLSVTATTIGGILSWLPSWYLPSGRLTAAEVTGMTVRLIEKLVTPSGK